MHRRSALLGTGLLLVAAGCDRRPATHAASAPPATAVPAAPASLLRLARGGGPVRAYDGRSLEELDWTSADRLPPLARVIGSDPEQRAVYALDAKRNLLAIDLPVRHSRLLRAGVTDAMVGAEASVFAVDSVRGLTQLSRRGAIRFRTALPGKLRGLYGTMNGQVIAMLTEKPELVLLTADGPVTTVAVPAGPTDAGMYGDVVAVAADSGVVLYEPASKRKPVYHAVGGHVRAVQFSPSGHRLYVGREAKELLVVDRYSGDDVATIPLPGPVAELRGDRYGNWLLARPAGRDSAWVIDLLASKVVGTVATTWAPDLPAITSPGTLAVRYAGDVVLVDLSADRLREVGRVRKGADDFWVPLAWAPPPPAPAPTPIATDSQPRVIDTVATVPSTPSAAAEPPPASEAAAGAGSWYLQVSSSRNPDWARGLGEKLKGQGLAATVLSPSTPDDPFRVVIGPYRTREAAEAAEAGLGMPAFVISVAPDTGTRAAPPRP